MNDIQSGAELLAKVRPRLRERGVFISLRPDLLDEWDKLTDELAEAEAEAPGNQRLAAGASTAAAKKIAKKIQAVEQEIEDTQIRFLFRAMPKDQWQALCDQHPPRVGNQLDGYTGYNREAVVDAAIRESLVSPVFTDCSNPGCDHSACGSWQQLEAVCNPSEWAALREAVDEVNSAVKNAPKSLRASQILDSGGTASRPRRSGT